VTIEVQYQVFFRRWSLLLDRNLPFEEILTAEANFLEDFSLFLDEKREDPCVPQVFRDFISDMLHPQYDDNLLMCLLDLLREDIGGLDRVQVGQRLSGLNWTSKEVLSRHVNSLLEFCAVSKTYAAGPSPVPLPSWQSLCPPKEAPKAPQTQMNILEFAERAALTLYPVQRFILKLLYGIPLDNTTKFRMTTMFTKTQSAVWVTTEVEYLNLLHEQGRSNVNSTTLPEGGFTEVTLSLGRRTGKSLLASLISAYEMYLLVRKGNPQAYYKLDPDRRISTLVVSPNRGSSAVVADKAERIARRAMPILTATRTVSHLDFQSPEDLDRFGYVKHNPKAKGTLRASFKSCKAKAFRGVGNITIILDEAPHFEGDLAETIYGTTTQTQEVFTSPEGKPEYKFLMWGTPSKDAPFFNQRYKTNFSSQKALCLQIPTWEMNRALGEEWFSQLGPDSFRHEFGGQLY